MGEPLHSFVICGELHEIEEQMYKHFYYDKSQLAAAADAEEVKEWPIITNWFNN